LEEMNRVRKGLGVVLLRSAGQYLVPRIPVFRARECSHSQVFGRPVIPLVTSLGMADLMSEHVAFPFKGFRYFLSSPEKLR
jgi:hypothetical protein